MTPHAVSLFLFAVAGAFTPGPNNLISAASGATFGFGRTLPQIFGVVIGFPVMVLAVGMGLGGLFAAAPQLHLILKLSGSAYLLYLAWKIARAGELGAAAGLASPLTLWQSALFQWVNPKAWTFALSVVPAFTTLGASGLDLLAEVLVIAAVMGAVTLPALSAWAGFGVALARILSNPRQRRLVNGVMAALVALSVFTLFL
ncbi:LysE family translocator [Ancylobacter terrae]|uniref:LysE family translocator n=1 Tax=Ancylobacter sp. sgz301288 TaxID=3342077 RepID=UPI003858CC5F